MSRLTPVDGNPFAQPRLTPVEGNPFSGSARIGAPRNAYQESLNERVRGYYDGRPNPTPDDVSAALLKAAQAGDQDAVRVILGTGDRVNQEFYNPTRGMSTPQLLAAGAGKAVSDIGLGARQLAGDIAPETFNQVPRVEIERRRNLDAPLMNTGAGFVGNVAGNVAMAAAPIPGLPLASRAGNVARNVIPAAAQPVGEFDNRAVNVATAGGLALGGDIAGRTLGRALSGTANQPIREAAEFAARQDIPVYPSQVTGSRALQKLSAAVNESVPFSGATAAAQRQQSAFNRALSRSFGIDAEDLSPQSMSTARQLFDQRYQEVFAGNPIQLDTDAAASMRRILDNARRELTAEEFGVVQRNFASIANNFQSGAVDGSLYQALRGQLYGAAKGGNQGRFIKQLAGALDASAARSLPENLVPQLRRTNQEYGNFRVVEDALRQVSGASNDVSPASLWNILKQRGLQRASPEMQEFARLGQVVLKNRVPDSGTTGRVAGLAGILGTGAGAIDIGTAGAALGTGALVGRGFNSARLGQLLASGVSPNTPQLNRLLSLTAPFATTQGGNALLTDDYRNQ